MQPAQRNGELVPGRSSRNVEPFRGDCLNLSDQWTSVFGKKGDYDWPLRSGSCRRCRTSPMWASSSAVAAITGTA